MKWFVQEQIEEEYIARRALELFDVLGEDKIALGMIEERILSITYNYICFPFLVRPGQWLVVRARAKQA